MFTSIKFALFIGLCFALQVSSLAQDLEKGQFASVIRAGLVTSQVYGDDEGGYNKLGGTAGIGVITPVSEKIKLQVEIDYAMRGSRKRPNPKQGDYLTWAVEPHYIDLPILFKSYIYKFEFEAGINNGILLFTRVNDPNFFFDSNPNRKLDFNRYEIGINVGVNVPINTNWFGNVRFHHSILPAAGQLRFVNSNSLLGGAYNNSLTFGLYRVFNPRD
jgi:hypothetical protein